MLSNRAVRFPLITLTVMRKSFRKLQPRIINYMSYKNFPNKKFKNYLWNELRNEDFFNNEKGFERVCNVSINVLNLHAPRKKDFSRGNQMPSLAKDISKEIMKRSRLRNRFLKNKSIENRTLYTQQRNFFVSILRKTKIRYYTNPTQKKIVDSNSETHIFW